VFLALLDRHMAGLFRRWAAAADACAVAEASQAADVLQALARGMLLRRELRLGAQAAAACEVQRMVRRCRAEVVTWSTGSYSL